MRGFHIQQGDMHNEVKLVICHESKQLVGNTV